MSDLSDELLRLAADGADKARPLTADEVMRRGNRKRSRIIGQRSLSGLSVLGVAAAVVMAGATHPFHGPATNPAAGAATRDITLTETTQSSAGTMTIRIKYRDKAADRIKPLSITVTGESAGVRKGSLISLALGRPPGHRCTSLVFLLAYLVKVSKNGRFTRALPVRPLDRGLCGNQAIQVSLSTGTRQIMTEGFILSR